MCAAFAASCPLLTPSSPDTAGWFSSHPVAWPCAPWPRMCNTSSRTPRWSSWTPADGTPSACSPAMRATRTNSPCAWPTSWALSLSSQPLPRRSRPPLSAWAAAEEFQPRQSSRLCAGRSAPPVCGSPKSACWPLPTSRPAKRGCLRRPVFSACRCVSSPRRNCARPQGSSRARSSFRKWFLCLRWPNRPPCWREGGRD